MAVVSRRAVIAGLGVICIAGAGFLGIGGTTLYYSAITEPYAGSALTAPEAFAMAQSGAITLIDIRRPDEWTATGSPMGAHRLDLRRTDFSEALAVLVKGQRNAPVAVICARGVRSAKVANRLHNAGFTAVSDVPEGMMGSAAGPGWLSRGLPLDRTPVSTP